MTGAEIVHRIQIAYVGPLKNITVREARLDFNHVFRVSRICELIDIQDPTLKVSFIEKVMDKIGADKTAAASDHEIIKNSLFHESDQNPQIL